MELLEAGVEYRKISQKQRQAAALAHQEISRNMVPRLAPAKQSRNRFLHGSKIHIRAESAKPLPSVCGNCTLVCPTCFCTTVEDRLELAGTRAERWRRWIPVTPGTLHIPRAGGGRRFRCRAVAAPHAQVRSWIDQFGAFGCVGCGRSSPHTVGHGSAEGMSSPSARRDSSPASNDSCQLNCSCH